MFGLACVAVRFLVSCTVVLVATAQNFATLGQDLPVGSQLIDYNYPRSVDAYATQQSLSLPRYQADGVVGKPRDVFVPQSIPLDFLEQILASNSRRRQQSLLAGRLETGRTYRRLHGRSNRARGQLKSGKGGGKKVKVIHKPVYVPVPIKAEKKKKKKRKIINVTKGFYIAGGSQIPGKFDSLKSCEKACANTAQCFAGDYDKWTKRCYMHTNTTACGNMQPHKKLTHFKKVPCSTDALGLDYSLITLGANLDHGLLQKGIKDIQTCIKKCLQAGGGVGDQLTPLNTFVNRNPITTSPQLCMGIDYDFSTHKCYFHTSATLLFADAFPIPVMRGIPGGIVCHYVDFGANNEVPPTPVNLVSNPSVVNIVICPEPTRLG